MRPMSSRPRLSWSPPWFNNGRRMRIASSASPTQSSAAKGSRKAKAPATEPRLAPMLKPPRSMIKSNDSRRQGFAAQPSNCSKAWAP